MIQLVQPLTYPRLAALVGTRLVLNAVFRVAYPLVPFVAVRYGVSVEAATLIVTVQVLAGIASPLGGWLGDRVGYRNAMALGLAIAGVGALLVAVAPTLPWILCGLVAVGIGTVFYQPSIQAYVSAATPLARRGRALGIIELSWSLAGIAMVPLLLRLAEWSDGLRVPFVLLGASTLAGLTLSQMLLPPDPPRATIPHQRRPLSAVVWQPAALALFAFLWLAVAGQEVLFIAQAPWLTMYFGASPEQIGQALVVFGIGELVGVSLATLLTDRIGKRRAPLLGFVCAALVYVALPILGNNWTAYLVVFFLYALCFEFAIVASFSLASMIDPAARGTIMAGVSLSTLTGRAAGSAVGVPLERLTTIVVNGIVASTLTLIGVLIAIIAVRPQEIEHERTKSKAVTIL
jgi:MFS transporter, DHA1 family, inner membrane transport protein